MKHGKKYIETAKLVDRATQYEPAEAIALVKKTAVAKFDETVEIHICSKIIYLLVTILLLLHPYFCRYLQSCS